MVSIDFEGILVESVGEGWRAGAAAGVLAGVVFGATGTALLGLLARVVLLEGLAAGWVVLIVLSLVLGLGYARVARVARVRGWVLRPSSGVVLGAGYGLVAWVVVGAVLVPVLVWAVSPIRPPIPLVEPLHLTGFLAYGVFLGGLYPLLLASEPTP